MFGVGVGEAEGSGNGVAEGVGDGLGKGVGVAVGVGDGVVTLMSEGADRTPRAVAVISALPAPIALASPVESIVTTSVLVERQLKSTSLNSFSVRSNALPANWT
jgi:hypothetical protein